MRILLVTGISGAGKASTLRTLEDLDFATIDNLPLSLLPTVCVPGDNHPEQLAIGIDVRSQGFDVAQFIRIIEVLRQKKGLELELLCLECSDIVLTRRFSETRRKHPLAADRPIADGIAQERECLAPLLAMADRVIDTTDFAIPELRQLLTATYGPALPSLALSVMSFSFARGLPRESDLVFDVRFLRNPHYDEQLRPLTGQNQQVVRYIADDKEFRPFLDRTQEWLAPLLPRYLAEGKNYLTIAVGCTGGRHRSVAIAELLTDWLKSQGYNPQLRHRELEA